MQDCGRGQLGSLALSDGQASRAASWHGRSTVEGPGSSPALPGQPTCRGRSTWLSIHAPSVVPRLRVALRAAKYCQKLCAMRAFGERRRLDGRLAEQRTKRAGKRAYYQKTYKLASVSCAACSTLVERKTAYTDRKFVCSYNCWAYLRFGKWPCSGIPYTHAIYCTQISLDHPCRRVVRSTRFMVGASIKSM